MTRRIDSQSGLGRHRAKVLLGQCSLRSIALLQYFNGTASLGDQLTLQKKKVRVWSSTYTRYTAIVSQHCTTTVSKRRAILAVANTYYGISNYHLKRNLIHQYLFGARVVDPNYQNAITIILIGFLTYNRAAPTPALLVYDKHSDDIPSTHVTFTILARPLYQFACHGTRK